MAGNKNRHIRLIIGGTQLRARLMETPTADAIWEALPLEARYNTWGDEIYFSIPVHAPESHRRETVEAGDLGYWEPGSAFCIFYGPTPDTTGDEIRPASAVSVFGHIEGDATVLRQVHASRIRVEREED